MERDRYAKHYEHILQNFPEKVCLKLDVLAEQFGLQNYVVAIALGKLVEHGFVERRRAGCYQLTKTGLKAKRTGALALVSSHASIRQIPADNFNQRFWSCIRMSGSFTAHEITMVVNWPIRHPEAAARRYLRHLVEAGYIVEMPKREKSVLGRSYGPKRYRLIKNTGLRAPFYREKLGVVHDPNTKEDVPCAKQA